MNARELATVLAALRVYQGSEDIGDEVRQIATNGGTVKALTQREIDGLCERLNDAARPIDATIPPERWREDMGGLGASRLSSARALIINGCPLHLEAYAVKTRRGVQSFSNAIFGDEEHAVLDTLVHGAAQTVTIRRRQYVLVATPYQA